MKLDKEFLKAVEPAITEVWQEIAGDMETGERLTNAICIEMCIDSDRMTTLADEKAADDLVGEAIKEHGYSTVLRFLSRNINLY